MDWTKIGWAAVMIVLLIAVFPRALHAYKNSPSATAKQWLTAIIPIGAVALFIYLLVVLARNG